MSLTVHKKTCPGGSAPIANHQPGEPSGAVPVPFQLVVSAESLADRTVEAAWSKLFCTGSMSMLFSTFCVFEPQELAGTVTSGHVMVPV
jgi:hypothetical protein